MDKSTLSNYGWIVIAVLVLSVMIALATPFGQYVEKGVRATTEGLFNASENALNIVGMSAKPEGIPLEGGKYYKSLKDAIIDANNCNTNNGMEQNEDALVYVNIEDNTSNVILIKDQSLNESIETTGNIIIYINGKTLSMSTSGCIVANGGNLTVDGNIKKSTVIKTIDSPTESTRMIRATADCNQLLIDGGLYKCDIKNADYNIRVVQAYDTKTFIVKNTTFDVNGKVNESLTVLYSKAQDFDSINNKITLNCTSINSSKNIYGIYMFNENAVSDIYCENNNINIIGSGGKLITGIAQGKSTNLIAKNNNITITGSNAQVSCGMYIGGNENIFTDIQGIKILSDFDVNAPTNAYGIQTFGTLTISDSKEMKTYISGTLLSVNIGSPAKVTINSGVFESSYCTIHAYNGANGSLDINGGVFRITEFGDKDLFKEIFDEPNAPYNIWISTGLPIANINNAIIEGSSRNGVFLSGGNGQTVNISNTSISALNTDLVLYTTGEIANLNKGTILVNNTISNKNGTVNDNR